MTLFHSIFGFSGRIGRFDFWMGSAAAAAVAWLAVMGALRLDLPAPFASAAGDVIFLSLFMSVAVKRGNDRGHRPAETVGLVLAVVSAAVALAAARELGAGDAVIAGLIAFSASLSVLAIVDLGFMLPPEQPRRSAAGQPAASPAQS